MRRRPGLSRSTRAACLLSLAVAAPTPAGQVPLETDEDKTLYAIGRILGQRFGGFKLSDSDVRLIGAGVSEQLLGQPSRVPMAEYEPRMEALLRSRLDAMAAEEARAGQTFRQKMATEPGAQVLDSGLVYFEVEPGSGPVPDATATVKLHYTGKLPDGTVFGSSIGGEPATFAMNGVVPCFSEGIQRMKAGGKSKLVCPPDIAYGNQGRPPLIRPGATLLFEIELLEIVDSARP